MRTYIPSLVVCLCVMLTSCSRSDPPASGGTEGTGQAPGAGSPGRPEGFYDAFGHLGQTTSGSPGGSYAIKCPYSQWGNEYVLSGYVERPGKPLGPAYLVLLRQESATSSSVQVDGGGR
jgi:hypothetical protein